MGKAAGVARRRKKTANKKFTRSKKLKRVRQRELRKTGGIKDDIIREAWDTKKSLRNNMGNMGLSHDPNKVMAKEERDKVRQQLLGNQPIVQSTTLQLHQKLVRQKQRDEAKKARKAAAVAGDGVSVEAIDPKAQQKKKSVADKLADEVASKPAAKNFRFGPDNIKFCAYMIEKHGDDYQAMVRDKANHYQESAGQIRAKIKKFLSIPDHLRVYQKAKEIAEANLDDDSMDQD